MCLHWYLYPFLTYSYLLCSCLFYIYPISIFIITNIHIHIFTYVNVYLHFELYVIYIYTVMTCYDKNKTWKYPTTLQLNGHPFAKALLSRRPGRDNLSARRLAFPVPADLSTWKILEVTNLGKPLKGLSRHLWDKTQSANICNELFFMRHKQWVTFSDKVWWQLLRSFSAYSGLPAEYRRTMYNIG